ncbi:MAG TPA: hypothetical protein VHV58_07970 [Pseudolabrys sp.]|nr:hypothetical protein [Pseudolabrys sp.]
MSFRNSVTIVASPRARVGKTLLARLLVDFHMSEGRSVAAFDLGSGDNTLTQFLPGHVTTARIGDIKGQMELFDRLVANDDAAKIVDVGVDAFDSFFTLAAQIGFAEEARGRSIAPAIMYVMTPDAVSVEAYKNLRERLGPAAFAPVHNEILGSAVHRDKYLVTETSTSLVRLPTLAPALRRHVDRPPFSFSDTSLASASDIPLDVHIELQRWLRRVYVEFRELDLRILLADLQSSIQVRP